MLRKYCECCKITLIDGEEDNHDICHVCGWEDDGVQSVDPDFYGGANNMSLNDARKYYAKILEENPNYRWIDDEDKLKSAVMNQPKDWNNTNYVKIDDVDSIISYDFDNKGNLIRSTVKKNMSRD